MQIDVSHYVKHHCTMDSELVEGDYFVIMAHLVNCLLNVCQVKG